MRIFEFAKKENLSVSKILEILNSIGIKDTNSNSKLDNTSISVILEISSGRKRITDFKEEIEVNILKRLPPEFKRTNPDKDYIVNHIGSSAFEPQNKLQVKHFESKEIKTYFDDYEAFSVCYGLKNRRAKFISKDYFERGLTTNAMEAHQLAMEAVSKYGLSAESKMTDRFTLSKLFKELQTIETADILIDKPFPTFNVFTSFLKGRRQYFTLEDGIKILKAYSSLSVYDVGKIDAHKLRIEKAKKQNEILYKRDSKGLLGVENPKKIRVNKKKKKAKVYSSIWTVKKK